MKKPHISISLQEGPQLLQGIKTVLAETKEASQELRDHKEAKRIVNKTAKRVAKEVRESNFPSALEGVKVTRRIQAKQKAKAS